ncbi:hypothetical protein [Roseomonas sp. 18066]|uniref:hypothetical protein n=1 Tax=Roseomonas sp. 18066 TaxID=2681412 RepID=UPI001357260D|nr:hypothetical protein [Roseomonas sp. 18066]
MTAPFLSPDCAELVKVMGELAGVFDALYDLLLDTHNSSTHPDAVRMHMAEALAQVDNGRRLMALEGGAE